MSTLVSILLAAVLNVLPGASLQNNDKVEATAQLQQQLPEDIKDCVDVLIDCTDNDLISKNEQLVNEKY